MFFKIEVRDATDDSQALFDPASVPTILIRDSNGSVVINYSNMTRDTTGVYTYSYQTDTTGPYGLWSIGFKVTDGTTVTYTPEQDGFNLVP